MSDPQQQDTSITKTPDPQQQGTSITEMPDPQQQSTSITKMPDPQQQDTSITKAVMLLGLGWLIFVIFLLCPVWGITESNKYVSPMWVWDSNEDSYASALGDFSDGPLVAAHVFLILSFISSVATMTTGFTALMRRTNIGETNIGLAVSLCGLCLPIGYLCWLGSEGDKGWELDFGFWLAVGGESLMSYAAWKITEAASKQQQASDANLPPSPSSGQPADGQPADGQSADGQAYDANVPPPPSYGQA